MSDNPHIIPRIAIQSIAAGLYMMALFTGLWAFIAHNGLNGRDHWMELVFFYAFCGVFMIKGAYFFSVAKKFPKTNTPKDIAEGKRTGKWFGIIFGAEGLGIFIGINIVVNLGYPDLVIPVIALVVGLHFYPLGWVFKRTIDYYLATWSTLIAIAGIVFSLNKTFPLNDILAFVGIGLAVATSCYGLYMISEGKRLVRMVVVE